MNAWSILLAKVTSVVAIAMTIIGANAESHTISFTNHCGRGNPQLVQNGKALSTGGSFTKNGPFPAAIAYLQSPNPAKPGSGSSVDLSLIPPHALNVPIHFKYKNGGSCNGKGKTCSTANCSTAFHVPTDTGVQVPSQNNDVDLTIVFCP
ncbi:glycopeptide [Dendrothele bispora CBS 962.96]|uniref:Glycopeptide n=1 Tax=Dendrothele bispora (strain CBS 962.96) TaxID=1314807 RepID=A0A4S8LV44_DENBC|nr:glycopeptide [Dendrothele bispora CBS 962.96]